MKERRFIRRVLSFALCLAMCVTLMPATVSAATAVPITSIEITVPTPVANHTAGENIAKITASNLNCDLSATWYSVSDSRTMLDNETFKAGNQYYLNIGLTAKSDRFNEYYYPVTAKTIGGKTTYSTSTKVSINGSSVTPKVDTSSRYGTIGTLKLTVKSGNFTAAKPVTVSAINIIGLQKPIAGQKVEDNLADLYMDDACYSDINRLMWFDVTTGNDLLDTDTFVAGHRYYLHAVVTPMSGTTYTGSLTCRFNRDSSLGGGSVAPANINGIGTAVQFQSAAFTAASAPGNSTLNIHWGSGDNGKILYWNPVAGAVKYSVDVVITGLGGGGFCFPGEESYDATFIIRKTGTYTTHVKALNSSGDVIVESDGPAKYFEMLPLDTPTNILVDNTLGVITWDSVANATGYTVTLKTEGGTLSGSESTNINSIQLGKLNMNAGEKYYVEIKAVDTTYRYGESAGGKSEVFTYTPTLTVTNIRWGTGANAKTIYWDPVPGATRYIVGVRIEGKSSGAWVDGSLTSFDATSDISRTGTYTPYVTAYKGEVRLTGDIAGQTKYFTVTPLAVPQNIQVDLDRRKVTWNAVPNANYYSVMLIEHYSTVDKSDIEHVDRGHIVDEARISDTNSISFDEFPSLRSGVHLAPNMFFVIYAEDRTGTYGDSEWGVGDDFHYVTRYAVNASVNGSGGSVSVQTQQKQPNDSISTIDSIYVDEGLNAYITTSCQTGYVVSSVKINGTEVTAYSQLNPSDRRYTVNNVQKNQNVVVTFSTCVHSWGTGSVTKPATCGATGVRTYTCSNCGETKTETISATGAHSYNAGVITTEPTCADNGVKTYTCSVCGNVRTELLARTQNHTYGAYTTLREATCTTVGIERRECTVCHITDERNIPMLAHTPVSSGNGVEATCTTAGKESDTQCSMCGTKLIIGDEIPSLGHAYGEWIGYSPTHHIRICANDPNHIEADYHFIQKGKCLNCGYEIGTLSIAGQPATAECGEEVEVCLDVNDTPGFISGAVTISWDSAAMTLTRIDYELMNGNTPVAITQGSMKIYFGDENATENCSDVGTLLKLVFKVAEHNASGNQTITVSADSEDFHRAGIDAVSVSTRPVTVTVTCGDHPWDEGTVIKAASCIEDGEMTYTCTCCGATRNEIITKLGHSIVTDEAVEATCTETGLTEGSHCSRCGSIFAGQNVVPAKGHSIVEDPYVFPTCTETGLEIGFHCSVCGTITRVQEVIPAKGHHVVTDYAVSPACTEAGLTEGKHCDICGEILLAQTAVPALGHCYGTDDSEKCTVCGAYKDFVGAKLGGYSLSLSDNIGVNFYMELAESVSADSSAKFVMQLPDGTDKEVLVSAAKKAEVNGETYYVFDCQVAAKEMTGVICAHIVLGDGTEGTRYEFTVQDYAKYILDHPSRFERAVPVVKAMLNYGASAQEYFEYDTGSLANEILSEADKKATETPDLSAYRYVSSAATERAAYIGTSLILESEVGFRCYFESSNGLSISNVNIKCNGVSIPYSRYKFGEKDGWKYIEVTGITPAEYDARFTVRAWDVTVENVSVYGYMANAFESAGDNSKLTAVLKSLYAYGEAAAGYAR